MRFSSMTPSARISSTSRAPRVRSRRSAAAGQAAAPPGRSAHPRPDRRAGDRAQRPPTTSAPTRSAVRCTRRCSTAASSRPTARASPSWTPRLPTSIPTGTGWPRSSSPTCAPKRAATRTTASLSDLIGELSTRSDDFRVRWAAHNVRFHRTGIKRMHHPVVGDLELSLRGRWSSGRRRPEHQRLHRRARLGHQQALDLLASWTATPAAADALPVTGEPDEH